MCLLQSPSDLGRFTFLLKGSCHLNICFYSQFLTLFLFSALQSVVLWFLLLAQSVLTEYKVALYLVVILVYLPCTVVACCNLEFTLLVLFSPGCVS